MKSIIHRAKHIVYRLK